MKTITVISSDKLSMTMFCDYYKAVFVGERSLETLDINCILSKSMQGAKIRDFIDINKDSDFIIIKYKTKPKTVLSLPSEVEQFSDYIVQFDMFSSHPNLLKDGDDKGKDIVDRYIRNISKMNGTL
jgi:hypothetical protein